MLQDYLALAKKFYDHVVCRQINASRLDYVNIGDLWGVTVPVDLCIFRWHKTTNVCIGWSYTIDRVIELASNSGDDCFCSAVHDTRMDSMVYFCSIATLDFLV